MDVSARLKVFLTEKKLVDVNFLVGTTEEQRHFSAHKLILSSASPVFETMFFGAIPEKSDPIEIQDIQPDVFEMMVDYMYTDEVHINNCNVARELWYAARKYMLPYLEEKVYEYIMNATNESNACSMYEFAKQANNNKLKENAMQIIRTKTKTVFDMHHFLNAEFTTLLDILDQTNLNISSEFCLYVAIKKYFENQGVVIQSDTVISNTEEDEKKSSIKLLLARKALMKIRFLLMKSNEFAQGPARCNALKDREIIDIFINILNPDSKTMPKDFSDSRKPRCPVTTASTRMY